MSHQELVDLQGYVKFFFLLVVCIVFYSYAYSIYKRQKSGEKDYEKYTSLVHDDAITNEPLEDRKNKKDEGEKT